MSNEISQSGPWLLLPGISLEPRLEMHPQWTWLVAIGLLSSAQTLVLKEETPASPNEVV